MNQEKNILETLSIYYTSRGLIALFLRKNRKVNFIQLNVFTLSILISFLLFLCIQEFEIQFNSYAQLGSDNIRNNKIVILNFDDGRKTQFTHAKPILDKYGFKATFYIVCNYVDNKKGFMTWDEIETLNKEGHDIGSHSMNHVHLSNLSKKHIEYEVGQSKKCLEDHGIEATSFAYPFNDGSNEKKVFQIVSKYYDLARIGNNPLTYLSCDGLKVPSF